MVFAPQLRGYRPLRLGNAHPALNSRQTTLAILAFLAFIITTWHWIGAPSHVSTPQLPAFRKQPKNWSVSGKGNLEGVTDFKKPANLSVVALVFYGRPATVSILDCYLKVRSEVAGPVPPNANIVSAKSCRKWRNAGRSDMAGTNEYDARPDVPGQNGRNLSLLSTKEHHVPRWRLQDIIRLGAERDNVHKD